MDVDVAYSVCVQPRNFLTAGWDRKKFHIVWLFTSLNLLLYTTTSIALASLERFCIVSEISRNAFKLLSTPW